MASVIPSYPRVAIEYQVVTPFGRTAHIFSGDAAYQRACDWLAQSNNPGWKVIKVTIQQEDVTSVQSLQQGVAA